MRLSKRCEYGIKAAVHLAQRHGTGYTQSREIAEAEALPAKFLESILLALRSASYLESKVGAGGGYRLARAPEQIRVIEIITLLDPSEPANGRAEAPSTAAEARQAIRAEQAQERAGASTLCGQTAMDVINSRLDDAILRALGELDLGSLATLSSEPNPRFDSRVVCC